MIVRFCPGFSYFRKCNRVCDECKDIIEEDMDPEIAAALNDYPKGCRPPVRGYGGTENIKITKTTPTTRIAIEKDSTGQKAERIKKQKGNL